MPKKSTGLHLTETKLRSLLHEIFASFDLITFDELIERLVKCIDVEVDLFVYIRERARFSGRFQTPEQRFLKFSFLAFETNAGTVSRFNGPKELNEREKLLLDEGFSLRESELCRVYFRAAGRDDIERALNLLMRIVVAFYINSGSLAHFRESVSSRFIADFFREFPNGTIQDLASFIERLTELKLTLWHQKDEMFFRSKVKHKAEDLLMPFPGLPGELPSFCNEAKFLGDLKTSVLRRNQTFGASEDGNSYYVVRTFSGVHFSRIDGTRWGNFHTRQKAVAIYTSRSSTGRIRFDEINYANSLIEKFINALDEIRQSEVVLNADRRCFSEETAIAEKPLATRTELYSAFHDVISVSFHEVLNMSFAEKLILWTFDPFERKLRPSFSLGELRAAEPVREVDNLDVNLDSNHLAVSVFKTGQPESLAHPLWIKTEMEQLDILRENLPDDRSKKRERIEQNRLRREIMTNSGPSDSSAGYAIPVKRGNITIGVLEAVSKRAGQLTFDATAFDRLASICGEAIRRIEMANDRAWLSRMSFVHAARHRIEELLREVESRTGEVGTELVEMIRSAQDANPEYMADDGERATLRIKAALQRCSSEGGVTSWLERFELYRKSYGFSQIMSGLIADIVETLVENRSHGNFSIADIVLSVEEPIVPSDYVVEVKYYPPDAWLEESRMERICVSPIPSKSSLTFHYGLFLLGSQIRMLGGLVEAVQITDEIGSSAFGICFKVSSL